jgi:hypothetical protein
MANWWCGCGVGVLRLFLWRVRMEMGLGLVLLCEGGCAVLARSLAGGPGTRRPFAVSDMRAASRVSHYAGP